MKKAEKKGKEEVDFSEVEFVSLSFADEIEHQARQRDIEIDGLRGDVAKMFEAARDKDKAAV